MGRDPFFLSSPLSCCNIILRNMIALSIKKDAITTTNILLLVILLILINL